MIGWLLDTNVISEIGKRRSDERVTSWFAAQPEETLFLSVLTLAEGDKGVAKRDPDDPERTRLAIKWQAIEERFEGRILSVTDAIARRWGAISGMTQRSGREAPVIDTLLAATALEHDLYFVTRNACDFRLSGAPVFNPWVDNAHNFPLASG